MNRNLSWYLIGLGSGIIITSIFKKDPDIFHVFKTYDMLQDKISHGEILTIRDYQFMKAVEDLSRAFLEKCFIITSQ